MHCNDNDMGLLPRFWEKVRRSPDEDGCWEWIGAKDLDGYGLFQIKTRTTRRAHRLVLAAKLGREILSGHAGLPASLGRFYASQHG